MEQFAPTPQAWQTSNSESCGPAVAFPRYSPSLLELDAEAPCWTA